MLTCIIAEKPSVARDIARIVGAGNKKEGYIEGNGYVVTWALGHLIGLASPEAYGCSSSKAENLPIIPSPFQLIVRQRREGKNYFSDPSASKQLEVIRRCFDECDRIIVGTDAGREGELIFRWIYEYLNCSKPFDRLWISSLTDKSIREGLYNLKSGSEYNCLYQSARSRAEADWLVGINASRALSMVRFGSYSLGRVQTPTLAMVCKRYLQNKDFVPIPYWRVSAFVEKDGISIKAVGDNTYNSLSSAQSALGVLNENGGLRVNSIIKKTTSTSPPLLYDLTALQKEANRGYGFTAEKTLSLAQRLYEKKMTTYPRTGSRYISEDVFEEVPDLLRVVGNCVLPNPLNRHSVDDGKVDDHHAILPTGQMAVNLEKDEKVIYEMIVTRFVEAFSEASKEEHMRVDFSDGKATYVWKSCRNISLGWKSVKKGDQQNDAEDEVLLTSFPSFNEGDFLTLISGKVIEEKTKTKPLYTEATLLSAMEHAGREVEDSDKRSAMAGCGIGTPATRASIIETLILRDYICRDKKKNIIPTEKGLDVYYIIKDKAIGNVEMTGQWELALSQIEHGELSAKDFRESIQSYTDSICKELLSLPRLNRASYEDYECPKCHKKSVGIYQKVVRCREEECDFHVFREVCGLILSKEDIKDLLVKHRTGVIDGFTSKSGKRFKARMILGDDFKTSFDFVNKKG